MMNRKLIILCIVTVLMLLQCSILVTKSRAETKTGTDGDVTWTFDTETGVLTYSGNGPITKAAEVGDIFSDKLTKKIIIGEGITDINDRAYLFCSALEEIEVDENNKVYSSMDGNLYNKDKSEFLCWPRAKAGDCVISNCVTKIGAYAFFAASKLTSVTIPDTVKTIGEYAFFECVSLKKVKIPNSVTSVEKGIFCECFGLEEVELPDGITSISDEMFRECYRLKYMELSDKVTSIGAGSFSAIPSVWFGDSTDGDDESDNDEDWVGACPLTIVIPNNVTSIYEDAFGRTEADGDTPVMTTIYCKSDSTIKQYIDECNEQYRDGFLEYIVDDNAPTIANVSQDGSNIVIDATDNDGVGIKKKGYSLDGKTWVESNKIEVSESGTYTIYVRDKLYNVSSKEITVDLTKKEDDKEENKERNETDDTQSDKIIPNTGAKFPIVIAVVLAIAGITYIKYKKYNF